jgi:glyoxylase I family protein
MAIDVRGLAPLLQIFDTPTSISFYRDALGFKVVSISRTRTDFGWALLSLNGMEIMLNTAYEAAERPLHPDPARCAAHSDTAIYFGPGRGCRVRIFAGEGR